MNRKTFLSIAALVGIALPSSTRDVKASPAPPKEPSVPPAEPAEKPKEQDGITYVFKGPGSVWTEDPLNQRCTLGARWVGSDGADYGIWFWCVPELFAMACREMREHIAAHYRHVTEEHISRGEESPHILLPGITPRQIDPVFKSRHVAE